MAETGDYKLVSSTLMLYRIIYEYIRVANDVRIAPEVGGKMVELMKLYNSKMC
jgi:hypothetical protein